MHFVKGEITHLFVVKVLMKVLQRKGFKTAHVKPKFCLNELLNIHCVCVWLYTVTYLLFHSGFSRIYFSFPSLIDDISLKSPVS